MKSNELFSLLNEGKEKLKKSDISNYANEAVWLLCVVTGYSREELIINMYSIPDEDKIQKYCDMIASRSAHMPIQYILKSEYFCGHEFYVDERVLIPRMETEILVDQALKVAGRQSRVFDLCAGSGAVGISIALAMKNSVVVCSDISESAVEVIKVNSKRLSADIEALCGDLFSPLRGRAFDIIVCNPPYIRQDEVLQPEVRYEPDIALRGGENGYDFYERIIAQAPCFLTPEGIILFEVGIFQAEHVAELLSKDFTDIEFIKDSQGIDRVVKGTLL